MASTTPARLLGLQSDSASVTHGFLLTPALPGDANLDGSVDGTDLNTVLSNYGVTSGPTWAMGDFNGDGAVDGTDLNIVLSNYGATHQRDRRRARTVDAVVGGRRSAGPAGLRLEEKVVASGQWPVRK